MLEHDLLHLLLFLIDRLLGTFLLRPFLCIATASLALIFAFLGFSMVNRHRVCLLVCELGINDHSRGASKWDERLRDHHRLRLLLLLRVFIIVRRLYQFFFLRLTTAA